MVSTNYIKGKHNRKSYTTIHTWITIAAGTSCQDLLLALSTTVPISLKLCRWMLVLSSLTHRSQHQILRKKKPLSLSTQSPHKNSINNQINKSCTEKRPIFLNCHSYKHCPTSSLHQTPIFQLTIREPSMAIRSGDHALRKHGHETNKRPNLYPFA